MRKLTQKTFFMLLALCLIISVLSYSFIGIFLPETNEKQTRRKLEVKTEELVSKLRKAKVSESENLFLDFIKETGADLILVNANREEVNLFTFVVKENKQKIQVQEKEYPFRFMDSDKEYILIAGYNPFHTKEITSALHQSLPFVGSGILLLSILSASLFSYYMTRPIIRVSKIADRIANLDFNWYCPDIRDDEIGELSKSINKMSDKLHAALMELNSQNALLADEIAFEQERERRNMLFFSGVSHELKTPIAIVIGQLEGMQAEIGVYKDREKYLARSAKILQSLNSFIKEILSISYIDMARGEEEAHVLLSSMIEELLNDYRDMAKFQAVRLISDIEEDIYASGNEKLLKKALGNAIGNAIGHSPENGTVSVTFQKKDDKSILIITNAPAHIEEEHLPHIYEAFYRAGKDTAHGSGLGLYILRMILDTYGVKHSIKNCGNGVRFIAEFEKTFCLLHKNST